MQTETVSVDQFRGTCGSFLTGITIATVFGKDNQPHGITVNSFTSMSLAPPSVNVLFPRVAFVPMLGAGFFIK
jgi:flavin reductase (DIM6/NTAB) family NADH-FMN oxidoreductase RutF